MNNELRPLTDLKSGSTLRVRDGLGRAIVVFEGQVWITQDNDPRDTMLAAGESFVLDRQGLALVQAFCDSKLMLLEVEPRTASSATAASSHELHRWAREQRSAAIGIALGNGLATLHNAVARAFKAASKPATVRPLTACTATR